MKRAGTFVVLLVLWWMFTSRAAGQDSLRQARPLPGYSNDSTLRVLTGVPFDGVFHFIKIVPLGRNFPDRMPIHNPERRPPRRWTRSIQRLVPDSLLKLSPGRKLIK